MRFFAVRTLLLTLTILGALTAAHAQERESEKTTNPCEPSFQAKITDPYQRLRWATQCLIIEKDTILGNMAQIKRNLSGAKLEEFRDYFRILIDLYPKFKTACENNTGEYSEENCWKFKTAFLDHPNLKNDVFWATIHQGDPQIVRAWIKVGIPYADPNRMNPAHDLRHLSARITAAEDIAMNEDTSTLEILQILVEAGLIHKNSDESFPLHAAIASKQVDRASYLIAQGWDVNVAASKPLERYLTTAQLKESESGRGTTPLIAAIINENYESFDELMALPNIDVNAPQALYGMSPLMIAANGAMITQNKKDSFYQKLLNDPRVDINFKTTDGEYTVLSMLIGTLKDMNNTELAGLITKLVNDKRFDVSKHCGPTQACLMALSSGSSMTPYIRSETFKILKPLVKKVDPSLKSYWFNGEKGLTFDEYLQRRAAAEPFNAIELGKIRAMVTKWQK